MKKTGICMNYQLMMIMIGGVYNGDYDDDLDDRNDRDDDDDVHDYDDDYDDHDDHDDVMITDGYHYDY